MFQRTENSILTTLQAFRPAKSDDDLLGPITSTVPNPWLTAPDELAGDIHFPTLDESLFSTKPMDIDFGSNDDNPLNWSTQLQSDTMSIEEFRHAPPVQEEDHTLYEADIDINFDEDPVENDAPPAPLVEEETVLFDDNLGLNFDEDTDEVAPVTEAPAANINMDMDIDQPESALGQQALNGAEDEPQPTRVSQSPLSSVRSSEVRDFDETALTEGNAAQVARQPAAKKRKVLPTDKETMLSANLIKQQQTDRSAILKPISLLPKDPLLLTLMTMQQNGGFVSSIMGDGRAKGLAPQLRGLLSIEAVRKAGSLKRKRDSGVADLGLEGDQQEIEMPQLQIPDEDDFPLQDEGIADVSKDEPSIQHILGHTELEQLAGEDAGQLELQDEDDELSPVQENFDDTRTALLGPEEQGPMSLGTQHAVHILRDHFGGSAEAASSKKGALFQDLYPEQRTTRAEATKMFFETLVLATKDAIKVEQASSELSAPIRMRAKRNLWGEWAEREAGGEIAAEENAAAAA